MNGKLKHGLSNNPIYGVWNKIKQRCFNPKDPAYEWYGKRGIIMCEEWKNNVSSFFHDLGPKPSKWHSVDRIDNDLGYTCGKCNECLINKWTMNCQWATKRQQSNNIRKNIKISSMGKNLTINEWGREYGLKRNTMLGRLRRGWCPTKVILFPLKHTNDRDISNYHELRSQVADYYLQGFSVTTLAKRHKVSTPCIRTILDEFGIKEIRKGGDSIGHAKFRHIAVKIVADYCQGASEIEIKQKYKVANVSIKKILKEANVPLRTHSEQCCLRQKWQIPFEQSPLKELRLQILVVDNYEDGESMNSLSIRFRIRRETIKKFLIYKGIHVRTITEQKAITKQNFKK